ncbi:MAG: hypothetical protein ACK58N_15525 [Synechocystis sp.]
MLSKQLRQWLFRLGLASLALILVIAEVSWGGLSGIFSFNQASSNPALANARGRKPYISDSN